MLWFCKSKVDWHSKINRVWYCVWILPLKFGCTSLPTVADLLVVSPLQNVSSLLTLYLTSILTCTCLSALFFQTVCNFQVCDFCILLYVACGGVVVKALRYKPAGRGFDSRCCHWNFSVTLFFRSHYGHGVDSASTEMSTRCISWVQVGRDVRLKTLLPSCAVFRKSGNLNFLESSGHLEACNEIALFLLYQLLYMSRRSMLCSIIRCFLMLSAVPVSQKTKFQNVIIC